MNSKISKISKTPYKNFSSRGSIVPYNVNRMLLEDPRLIKIRYIQK